MSYSVFCLHLSDLVLCRSRSSFYALTLLVLQIWNHKYLGQFYHADFCSSDKITAILLNLSDI